MEIQSTENFKHSRYALQQMRANAEQSKQLRANSAVPNDAWGSVDNTVYQTKDNTLTVVSDLLSAGLRAPASIFDKTVEWEVVDDQGEATIGMDVETADSETTVSYGLRGAPLPVIWDTFSLGLRDQPSPSNDQDMTPDVLGPTVATRNVGEGAEDLVMNGWGPSITAGSDTYSAYGLTNHPDISTGTLGDWQANPSAVRSDIRAMASAIKDDKFRPGNTGFWLYFSSDLEDVMDDADPEGSGDMTIGDRVANLSDISRMKVSDFLPSGSAVMFRPTRDVIDIAVGQDIEPFAWESPDQVRQNWRVLGCMTPRVKSTKSGQSGISFFN